MFFVFSLFSFTSYAISESPVDMLQSTSNQMIQALQKNKTTIKSDPKTVFNIVYKILLPKVDMNYMSKSVLGRNIWAAAKPEEKKTFTEQFTQLLVRTYASALASYSDQHVEFFPLRQNYQGQTQIEIKSQIVQPGGPPIPVSYRLILEKNQWKIIDFNVENISIAENFRAQFSQDLNQGGLKLLNQKLLQHNAGF